MKKFTALIILAALTASQFACGDTAGPQETTSDTTTAETTQAETGIVSRLTPELKAELGLDGYEFNVLLRQEGFDWSLHDMTAEEENGEALNDAVYARNRWLEENCGFGIKVGYSSDTQIGEMRTIISAGDTTYDAFFPSARYGASAAQEGLLYDLNELRYIDFDNGWNRMLLGSLEIDNKLFYASGAISTNSYDGVRMLFFNKTLNEKYKLDDPYQLVREGKWTLDNFNAMAVKTSTDLNGDAKMTVDDQYGLTCQDALGGTTFYYGCGERLTENDKNGKPVITVGSERSTAVYNRIRDMISDKDTCYQGNGAEVMQMFYEGHSLFFSEVLDCAKRMRPYDIDFGILPLPKYDEAQTEYVQFVDGFCLSPVVVAKNAATPERTGWILQAIAEASKEMLVDTYYDLVLTGKALRDDESAEMLDIVVNNFVLDNCDLYSWSGLWNQIKTSMNDGGELSSLVAANRDALGAAIKKTLENIG